MNDAEGGKLYFEAQIYSKVTSNVTHRNVRMSGMFQTRDNLFRRDIFQIHCFHEFFFKTYP